MAKEKTPTGSLESNYFSYTTVYAEQRVRNLVFRESAGND